MASPALSTALAELKAQIAAAQETLTATDRNHFARQLGNLKKQVSAPARELAEHEWAAVAAVLKAEVDRSQELQDRIAVQKTLAHLDAEHAHAQAAKAKRQKTAYELSGGRMDGKTMDGSDDETPKL